MTESIRAVNYARYSSDNQREESATAQLRAGNAYIKRKQYIHVGDYVDEELTGRNDRRDDFQRMIKDAKQGLFDVIVIHKVNRFARNRYDAIVYKRELKRNGVRVESVLENLDPDAPETVLMESLLEGLAEYYSLDLAREVMKGMHENAEQGIHTGGRPPYGFKISPTTRKLEVDEEKARAVQIYFESIKKKIPLEVIANTLNDLGYRTQSGLKFTKTSFDGWACNRKYIGDYVWNVSSTIDIDGRRNTHKKKPKEEHVVHKGILPKIIEPELFWEVNGMMNERKHRPGTMKARVNYLLSGKILCGACGAAYNGNSYRNTKSKDKPLLSYYKCSAKCGNTNVRKEDIEKIAIEQLIDYCFSEESAMQIVARVKELYQEHRKSTKNDIDPIRSEIKELGTSIENWITALGKGIKGLDERIIEAQNRKELLTEELRRIEIVQKKIGIDDQMILTLLEQKKNLLLSGNEDEKKQILQEYVDRIIIQPSRDINNFDVEVTYRVFNGGGELTLFKTLCVTYGQNPSWGMDNRLTNSRLVRQENNGLCRNE
ncbi:MAG: recombinase family protein [Eubacteriales bacterium]